MAPPVGRNVKWAVALVAALAGAWGLSSYAASRARKRRARVRVCSQVFHNLPITYEAAPFEDDPDALARAAVRRLLDPNVTTSAADTSARVLRDLEEDVGLDWRSACPPEDAARAGTLVSGVRDLSPEKFASALDEAVADWTRSAGFRDEELPSAPFVAVPSDGFPCVRVRLDAPDGAAPCEFSDFAVPDSLERARVTAADLRTWREAFGPFRPPFAVNPDAAGWTAVCVPGLSLHVWTSAQDGRRFHFQVAAGETHVRPEGEFPLPLVGRPVVDGEPVPVGTVLVPGRVDWAAARALSARACRGDGISHFVHAGSDFARTTLAASSTLTAVHPDRGVAWLSFDGRTAPSGSWERGEISIASADGAPLRTLVALRPVWDVGEEILGSTGVEPRHHVDPGGSPAFVLRGLPCGSYAVRFDLVTRGADGTPNVNSLGSVPVSITPDRPRVEVVEPKRR